jgi:hypothetical protein
MTEPYTATVGADVIGCEDSLAALLEEIGPIHEQGDSIAIWQGSALLVVIDGQGHTVYLTDPEAHRV